MTNTFEWFDNCIVVWKWGVWKSSCAWWLANLFSKKWNVLITDTDSAPSSIDVFWYNSGITEDHKLHTRMFQVRDKINTLIIWPIIPRILNDPDHKKLNKYMDTLLNNEYWLLPLLRLILQTNFYWIPADHKFFALVLQLIELFIDEVYYSINIKPGEEWIKKVALDKNLSNFRIIDAENTSSFFDIVYALQSLTRTIENIHEAHNTTFWAIWTKAMIKWSANLGVLAESNVIKSPKGCLKKFELFKQMIETKTKILMVTRPWITEFNQLQLELKELKERNINPRNLAVVINYYNQAFQNSPESTRHFVDSVRRFLDSEINKEVEIKLIDCEFVQPDISDNLDHRKKVIDENFERVWECLAR